MTNSFFKKAVVKKVEEKSENQNAKDPRNSPSDAPKAQLADGQQDKTALVVPLDAIIVKSQVRNELDQDFIQALSQNIKAHQQMQPITVVALADGQYLLESGENRFRAISLLRAQEPEVPLFQTIRVTVVENDGGRRVRQFHENVQRCHLNPVDEAKAIRDIAEEMGLKTEREIGDALHIPQKRVNRRLSLLKQSQEIQDAVAAGNITQNDIDNNNVVVEDVIAASMASTNDKPASSSAGSKKSKKIAKKKLSPSVSIGVTVLNDLIALVNEMSESREIDVIERGRDLKPKQVLALLVDQIAKLKETENA